MARERDFRDDLKNQDIRFMWRHGEEGRVCSLKKEGS